MVRAPLNNRRPGRFVLLQSLISPMQMALEQTHWGGRFLCFALPASPPRRPHGWIDAAKVLIYLIWSMIRRWQGIILGILPPPPLTDKLKREFRTAAERFVRNSDAVAKTARLFQPVRSPFFDMIKISWIWRLRKPKESQPSQLTSHTELN